MNISPTWYLPPHQASIDTYDALIASLSDTEEQAVAELHHTVQRQLSAYSTAALLSNHHPDGQWWTKEMDEWSKKYFPTGMQEAARGFFYDGHNRITSGQIRAFANLHGDEAKQPFATHTGQSVDAIHSLNKPIFLLIQSWIDAGYDSKDIPFDPTADTMVKMAMANADTRNTAQHWLKTLGLWDEATPSQSPLVAELTKVRDGMRGHISANAEALARCWVISSAVLAAIGHSSMVEDHLHIFDGEAMRYSLADAGVDAEPLLEKIHKELAEDLEFQAIMLEASAQALRRGFLEEATFAGCPTMTPKAGLRVQEYRYEQGDTQWRPTWDNATIHSAQECVEQLEKAASEARQTHQAPTLDTALTEKCKDILRQMGEYGYQSTANTWIYGHAA